MLFCPNKYLKKAIPGKLGMRGSATGDLHFDNVHVPAENVLIGEGRVPRTFEPSLPRPNLYYVCGTLLKEWEHLY